MVVYLINFPCQGSPRAWSQLSCRRRLLVSVSSWSWSQLKFLILQCNPAVRETRYETLTTFTTDRSGGSWWLAGPPGPSPCSCRPGSTARRRGRSPVSQLTLRHHQSDLLCSLGYIVFNCWSWYYWVINHSFQNCSVLHHKGCWSNQ